MGKFGTPYEAVWDVGHSGRCTMVVDDDAHAAAIRAHGYHGGHGSLGAPAVGLCRKPVEAAPGLWRVVERGACADTCLECSRWLRSRWALWSVEDRRKKRAQRDRVIAAFIDTGASYRETAREVGCSVGTVAGAAKRIRELRAG